MPQNVLFLPFLPLDTLLSLQTEYSHILLCFRYLIRMGSALLSRFDLVFIILDKPDEDLDSLLSEHVMTLHCGKKRTFNTSVLREVSEESSCNHYFVALKLVISMLEENTVSEDIIFNIKFTLILNSKT